MNRAVLKEYRDGNPAVKVKLMKVGKKSKKVAAFQLRRFLYLGHPFIVATADRPGVSVVAAP